MKKLSKEKRQQLVLTLLITATVMFGLWYLVVRAQLTTIATVKTNCASKGEELRKVKATIARAEEIRSEMAAASEVLTKLEEKMGSGDLYAWAITSIRDFKAPYKIDIPQFSQIDGPRASTLFPNFPYKQASITISGTGMFHDIGTFIADFENENPFSRICNLVMEPAAGPGSAQERLSFKMDIVALVKPQT